MENAIWEYLSIFLKGGQWTATRTTMKPNASRWCRRTLMMRLLISIVHLARKLPSWLVKSTLVRLDIRPWRSTRRSVQLGCWWRSKPSYSSSLSNKVNSWRKTICSRGAIKSSKYNKWTNMTPLDIQRHGTKLKSKTFRCSYNREKVLLRAQATRLMSTSWLAGRSI